MNTTTIKQSPVTATRLADTNDFSALLDKEFKPKTEEARDAVEAAVRTLAEQALVNANTMTDDAYGSIEAIIAEIDRKLSEQINLILHKPEFQKIESAWRGMHHLVCNTETDEKLKIRFMDISKDEMRRTMRRHKGIAWDQSPVFKRIYEEEYGQLGGEPYGCLVADYYFDHTPADVELLGAIAKISAASHAPFIAGSSPSLLGMESWQELANPRDLAKITSNLEHAPWTSLRNTEDARYVGLAMPRFLARLGAGKFRLMRSIPVWVTAAVLSLVLLGLFGWYKYQLLKTSVDVERRIAAIGQLRPPPAPPVKPMRLKELLSAEVARGTVSIDEDDHHSALTFKGDDMFVAGQARLNARIVPVLVKVADEINQVAGTVQVTGHSDNQPIRTREFPDNQTLSEKRAAAAAQVLQDQGVSVSRLKVEGRGDTVPLADNATAAGRARNRRVDIVVTQGAH